MRASSRSLRADRAVAARHLRDWSDDLCRIGYTPEFANAVRGAAPRLAAITFTPSAAFQQTPGPGAGQPHRALTMPLTLHAIRPCFEGAVPAVIATCALDGTPNVSYISEVHYVDPQHVALSFQFFSKTRQNVLENPRATVVVIHPDTGAQYKLAVRYLRTEDSGPLFECMKAKLAGIASHAGMTGVFRLRGSDVYRVESITEVYGTSIAALPARSAGAAELRCCMTRLSSASDLAGLLDALLDGLAAHFGIAQAMVLMGDAAGEKLYTVASRGYPQSGVGAEIRPGEGVIGTAALARTPIRISHATSEFGYGRAMREDARSRGITAGIEQEIAFPGLPESQSQIAVPILAGERLLGVLFAESAETSRFGYDEEDALAVLASHVGAVAALLEERDEAHEEAPAAARSARPGGRTAADSPLRGERQHLCRRGLPDQGRGRRDPVETAAQFRRRAAHRAHEPRATPRPVDPSAGPEREPRGPADPAAAPPRGALPGARHREDGPRTLPIQRPAARAARRDPALTTAQRAAACGWSTCGTNTKYGVRTLPPGAT